MSHKQSGSLDGRSDADALSSATSGEARRVAMDLVHQHAQAYGVQGVRASQAYWQAFRTEATGKHLPQTTIEEAESGTPGKVKVGKGDGPVQAYLKSGKSPEQALKAGKHAAQVTGREEDDWSVGDKIRDTRDGGVTITQGEGPRSVESTFKPGLGLIKVVRNGEVFPKTSWRK